MGTVAARKKGQKSPAPCEQKENGFLSKTNYNAGKRKKKDRIGVAGVNSGAREKNAVYCS